MTSSSWRACLRIARRDALRAPGRSLLVLVMVALPIIGMTAADVLYRTSQLDPAEKVTRAMGAADAVLSDPGVGGRVEQNPDASQLGIFGGPGGGKAPGPEGRSIETLLSSVPGVQRTLVQRSQPTVLLVPAGRRRTTWVGFDYADPMVRGVFRQLQGRAPQTTSEVAVSPMFARSLHLHIGDQIHVADGPSYTITGLVQDPSALKAQMVVSRSDAMPTGVRKASPESPDKVYVKTASPVTWRNVLTLNQSGIVVLSRYVFLHPPAPSEIPGYDSRYQRNLRLAVAGVILLVVGLASLEVVLLAGAAFAVGARRQRRALALVAVAGGEPRHVRRIVLAGGIQLGAVGAAVGIPIGIAVAAASRGWLTGRQQSALGHFDVRPLELLAILAVGTLTGLLAALLPARGAARNDVVAVLAGRAGTRTTPLRVPIAGLAVAGLGIALAAAGEAAGQAFNSAKLILAGTVVVQIGVLVLTPALVAVAGRLGRRLPVAGRLALRDAARHRGRTAPAVGAVMAAVAGSTALAVYAVSSAHHMQREYVPQARTGVVTVQLDSNDPSPSSDAITRLRDNLAATLPTRVSAVVRTLGCYGPQCKESVDLRWSAPAPKCNGHMCISSTSFNSAFGGPVVGDAHVLRAFLGHSDKQLEDALAAGKAIAFVPGGLKDGKVTFERQDQQDPSKPPISVSLPGIEATPVPGLIAMVPESMATQLGEPHIAGIIVDTTTVPTQDQEDAARQVAQSAPVTAYLSVERGYHSSFDGVLLALLLGTTVITLGAAGIATGLAAADGRADLATLAAVGAAPGTRRKLAAAQAFTVAGLGTVLGVAAGFVPAVAFISRLNGYTVDPPWGTLAVLVVGIPLTAAALAALLTRGSLPLIRRAA